MAEIVYDIKKKYSELDSWIAGLTSGTYNVEVDCKGITADQFEGDWRYLDASPFGNKLKAAKEGVLFNLKPINIAENVTNANSMFNGCTGLTSIDTSAFTNVKYANYMFYDCSKLTSIDTKAFTQVTSASYMFNGCSGLTSIDTSAFTNVKYANHMFYKCTGLTSIDTKAFTQVTDAESMFDGCEGLTSIDTSAFTKVTNAENMFLYCTGLTSIDTSAFTKVTNANSMFNGCTGLTSIDTSAFTQVTNAVAMFDNCTGLTSITGTEAFTQVTNASSMFYKCTGLTSIDTKAFTQVTSAFQMFYGCSGLTSIDTSAFTQVTNAYYMFSYCSGLTSIDTKAFTQVITAEDMFDGCTGLKSIDTTAFTQVINANRMFNGCTGLTSIDTKAFTNVTKANEMFYYCRGLTSIDWGNIKPATNSNMFSGASATKIIKVADQETKDWIKINKSSMSLTNFYFEDQKETLSLKYDQLDIEIPKLVEYTLYDLTVDCNGVGADQFKGDLSSHLSPFGKKLKAAKEEIFFNLKPINIPENVTDATGIFNGCTGLTSIDTKAFTNIQYAESMFQDCSGLTSIDTKAFTNVTNAENMFSYCTGLTSIDTKAFTQVTNATCMFRYCSGLTSIDTKAFTQVTDASYMFNGCSGLTSIDTSAFTNVKYASYMFNGCSGLTSIDTSAFTNVKYASYMFNDCSKLTSIDTKAFTQVTTAEYMFTDCSKLTSIDTKAFTQVYYAEGMFWGCSGLTSIDWGNIKPATNSNMFYNASATKIIKVADQETKDWIDTNDARMKLTSATIEVGTCPLPNPIKYSDLSSWIPEYSLTSSVDLNIIEISKEAFTSELNNILKSAQNVTSINLKMEAPADLTSLASSFIDNTKLTKVDISNFTTVTDTASCFKGCANLAEINWGSIKPATNTDMFLNASTTKIIKANDASAYKFIKTNENSMKLSNYSVIASEGTKAPEEMLFEEFDFYKPTYKPGTYPLKFTDDVTLDPSNFVGTADLASPLVEAIKIPEVSFDFKVELPEGLNDLNYTFNKATYINTLEINWKDNKPSSHTDTFKDCTATKKIIIGALDKETRSWIETNEAAMSLTKYEIIGGSDTINYENLDAAVKGFKPGEYTFNIDTTGAAASNFKGTSSKDSDFNGKLKSAKEGVYYNINLDIPANNISYMLYNNKNIKSIKINKFVPATKARTLAEPSITADNAFDGCTFKEINLNAFNNVTSAKNMLNNNSNLETIYDNSGNCFEKGLDASSSNVKTVYTTKNGKTKMVGKFPSSTKFYEKYERLTYAKGNYEGVNPDNNHILGDMIIDGSLKAGTTSITGATSIEGVTNINITGESATTIGSATGTTSINGTTSIEGTTNINTTGESTTTIGNTTGTTSINGTTTIEGTTNINTTGESATTIGNDTGKVEIKSGSNSLIIENSKTNTINGDTQINGNLTFEGESSLKGKDELGNNFIKYSEIGNTITFNTDNETTAESLKPNLPVDKKYKLISKEYIIGDEI